MKVFSSHIKSISFIGAQTFAVATLLFTQTAYAEHPGKVFHDDANCLKCHTSKPYDPTKSDSWPKLVKAVTFCNNNLNTGLFEDEVEQLADYLNQTYYKHPK